MEGEKVCMICSNNVGKYACPRCNVFYCSVDCYRAEVHSSCSEAFYKDCIADEIKSQETNPDAQKKMLEILQRMQQQQEAGEFDEDLLFGDEEDDGDDLVDLADRLKHVDLEDADTVWQCLTEEERNEFQEMLKSGNIDNIVPKFEPWWTVRDDKKVVDLDKEDEELKGLKQRCPKVENKVVPFINLSKVSPSSTVCYNLANVLAAYSVIVRYYNGEHKQYVSESTPLLVAVSTNLSSNQNFPDLDMAVKSVNHEITNCQCLSQVEGIGLEMEEDVKRLFIGPNFIHPKFYVECALGDLYSLLRLSLNSKKREPNEAGEFSKQFPDSFQNAVPELQKSKVKLCLRKIEYFQSWAKDHFQSPY
ncbi:zinc finger HIT domain-containing protein 2 [Nilaparvata lugens]|uniref:zinc finger HIT domain-containing protein 2 n=1 Tax=Nilaparvata lugens TaxID=108931 RepID=UPI00193E63A8|nr:zinc finger HIT domain-containing protein 2 [Nilaparvata lugens]